LHRLRAALSWESTAAYRPKHARRTALALTAGAIVALAASAGTAHAAACNDEWHGGNGVWNEAGKWTAGVPTASSNVCITKEGTYTVKTEATLGGGEKANSITVGGSSGKQTLLIIGSPSLLNGELTLTNASDGEGITAKGELVLGTTTNETVGELFTGTGTLKNTGTITSATTDNHTPNQLIGNLDNKGTLNVANNLEDGVHIGYYGTWTSSGTINIAAGQSLVLETTTSGSLFTQSGGTIDDEGNFRLLGGGFVAAAGTDTGNPIALEGSVTINPSGSGSGVFDLNGSEEILTGDVAPGYTLYQAGVPNLSNGRLIVEQPYTNHGTIVIGSTNGTHGGLEAKNTTFTNDATIISTGIGAANILAGGSLVNNGTLTIEHSLVGSVQITNNGVISIAAGELLEPSLFTQTASGTLNMYLAAATATSKEAIARLIVLDGPANLGGTLHVTTTGTITAHSLALIIASVVNGNFAQTIFTGQTYRVFFNGTALYELLTGAAPTPTPTPAPAAASPKPSVGNITGAVDGLSVHLSCPAGGGSCLKATVTATITEHIKGSKITAVSAKAKAKTTTKKVTIASSSLTLAAGKSVTLKLKLNATGNKLLAKYRKLSTKVTVTVAGKVIKTATVHLTASKKTKKKKGK
jgi:hypothetical protein